MAEFVTFENATLVSGVTSTQYFLPVRLNDKNIGVHLYEFNTTDPDVDLVPPTTPLKIKGDITLYDSATSYSGGAGLAVTINNSALAIPLFKIPQDADLYPDIEFETPTIVTNLTSLDQYCVVSLDNTYYGIPVYSYGCLYTNRNMDISALSAIAPPPVNTVIRVGKPTLDVTENNGGTYLNSRIKTYSDAVRRIKQFLGHPTINLDMCDDIVAAMLDQSVEFYTKYAGYTDEYLIFNTNIYQRGYGLRLDKIFSSTPEMRNTAYGSGSASFDYDLNATRKVLDVYSFGQGQGTGVNTLFTIEQAFAEQTYFQIFLPSHNWDLVTWDIMKQWLDVREKTLAQTPYYRFDPKTQLLRIIPEPYPTQAYYGLIGCYVIEPIKDIISERWVLYYATALTKIHIGNVRGKYNIQMMGGGTVNYNDMLQQGLTEKKELETELLNSYGEATPPLIFLQ